MITFGNNQIEKHKSHFQKIATLIYNVQINEMTASN